MFFKMGIENLKKKLWFGVYGVFFVYLNYFNYMGIF